MEHEEWEIDIKFPRLLPNEDSACSEASASIIWGVIMVAIFITLFLWILL